MSVERISIEAIRRECRAGGEEGEVEGAGGREVEGDKGEGAGGEIEEG